LGRTSGHNCRAAKKTPLAKHGASLRHPAGLVTTLIAPSVASPPVHDKKLAPDESGASSIDI
jgi:hypothetical protein